MVARPTGATTAAAKASRVATMNRRSAAFMPVRRMRAPRSSWRPTIAGASWITSSFSSAATMNSANSLWLPTRPPMTGGSAGADHLRSDAQQIPVLELPTTTSAASATSV